MDITKAQVLITGGSEGIGFELAKRFVAAGATVLITGRSAEKLAIAAKAIPGLLTFQNDIGKVRERMSLAAFVSNTLPELTILINNAGIQRRTGLASDQASWEERQTEMDILVSAPIHLNHLLIPLLLRQNKPALIANVSSGGAFIPQPFAPVYSACKAAVHSYTMNLRYALSETLCRVVEIIPPAVSTHLAGSGTNHGVSVTDFCDAVFPKLIDGASTHIGFGPTAELHTTLNGKPLDELFESSAPRFPVEKYRMI